MKGKMYISIPMSGRDPAVVAAEAAAAALIVEVAGFEPVNPVRLEPIRADCSLGCVDYRASILADLRLIRQCDGIFLCDGWTESLGCLAEATFAHAVAVGRGVLELSLPVGRFTSIYGSLSGLDWTLSEETFIWVGGRACPDIDMAWRDITRYSSTPFREVPEK